MMKLFLICICFCFCSLEIGQVYAEEPVLLKKINKNNFDDLRSEVKKQVSKEMDTNSPAHFDESQSFKVVRNGSTEFNLVPVTFNSKKAKNNICILSVFSEQNQLLKTLPLHSVQGDGDEIIESCVGVQAVALALINNVNSIVYLLRYRSSNMYGDTVFIGSIDSYGIEKNEVMSNCVSNQKDISSMINVRKAIKLCTTPK
jgi:hypothetical protein